jgi:hypothetical protein
MDEEQSDLLLGSRPFTRKDPELTCQHVGPETSVKARQMAVTEVKILIFKGTLDDVLRRVREQRSTLH